MVIKYQSNDKVIIKYKNFNDKFYYKVLIKISKILYKYLKNEKFDINSYLHLPSFEVKKRQVICMNAFKLWNDFNTIISEFEKHKKIFDKSKDLKKIVHLDLIKLSPIALVLNFHQLVDFWKNELDHISHGDYFDKNPESKYVFYNILNDIFDLSNATINHLEKEYNFKKIEFNKKTTIQS